MAEGVFTPYSTVSPMIGAVPGWVPKEEQERIASYEIYEQIYWNVPQSFKLIVRGSDTKPVYLPSGRIIVNTMNRHCARGLGFAIDPALGSPSDQANLQSALSSLFARERWNSKFNSAKRKGLIEGDIVFHITADSTKAPGTRLSLHVVSPSSYFPVPYEDDLERMRKVHLAEQFVDSSGKPLVKRQTYERLDNGTIKSTCGIYEADSWNPDVLTGTPKIKKVRDVFPDTILPPDITAIPVYHIKNREEDGNPYGSSEMRGLERVFASMNQSMTDEDLTLALEGLGLYKSGNGAPVDDNGDETDWILGPGRVVEDPTFERVQGVRTVQPFGDHISRLWSFAKEAAATPDVATGQVDVQVAESGVALALKMDPIIAESEEKEEGISGILRQMYFDLKTWLRVYESIQTGEAIAFPTFKGKLPQNRKAEVELISTLVTTDPPIMSAMTAREHLEKYDLQFADDEVDRIAQEQQLLAESRSMAADPYGERLAAEAGANGGGDASATNA